MKTCCLCGRDGQKQFVQMPDGRWRCRSGPVCQRRIRAGRPRETAGRAIRYRPGRAWEGPELMRGVWVSMASGPKEVTRRKHMTWKDLAGKGASVTFEGPVEADAVVVSTSPAGAPAEAMPGEVVRVGEGWKLMVKLVWDVKSRWCL